MFLLSTMTLCQLIIVDRSVVRLCPVADTLLYLFSMIKLQNKDYIYYSFAILYQNCITSIEEYAVRHCCFNIPTMSSRYQLAVLPCVLLWSQKAVCDILALSLSQSTATSFITITSPLLLLLLHFCQAIVLQASEPTQCRGFDSLLCFYPLTIPCYQRHTSHTVTYQMGRLKQVVLKQKKHVWPKSPLL